MLIIYLSVISFLLYYIITRKYKYWKNKKVPHAKPTLLFGNYADVFLLRKDYNQTVHDICKQFPDAPMVGAYFGTEPVLIPKDPELIKLMVIKDFQYFNGRELTDYIHKEQSTLNLFHTYGDAWKVLRQNLTPLFSSAKMKNMFHMIADRTQTLEKLLEKDMGKPVGVKSLMERYTTEAIGACVFGVDAHTMTSNENNPFRRAGRDLIFASKYLAIKRNIRAIWPRIFYGLQFQLLNKELKIFGRVVQEVFEQRNNKQSSRNYFVDIFLKWKEGNHISGDGIRDFKTGETKKVTIKVNDELLLAQCLVFFVAGFNTSATTSSFTMYELAKSERAMKKVLEEVDAYFLKHDNKITYEYMSELPYLDACIDEALRLYPVLGVITREVMKGFTLPNGTQLEKGLRIHLPVYHLHHDPKFFPEPEQFRPERFFGEEKRNIVAYSYMPFGEGPRTCIGLRFAKMQMLATMATILKTYTLELDDNTPRQVEFKAESFIIASTKELKVKFVKRV